jgi:ankyrin repeat protein
LDGRSSLYLAAHPGYASSEECVRVLIAAGADVDVVDGSGRTVFIYGCDHGWPLAIVKLLLEAGANVNYQSNRGWSAFVSASRQGHLEHVRLLLDFGADPNLASYYGWTCLMRASRNHLIILKLWFF